VGQVAIIERQDRDVDLRVVDHDGGGTLDPSISTSGLSTPATTCALVISRPGE
jgi:hypothetical protein